MKCSAMRDNTTHPNARTVFNDGDEPLFDVDDNTLLSAMLPVSDDNGPIMFQYIGSVLGRGVAKLISRGIDVSRLYIKLETKY